MKLIVDKLSAEIVEAREQIQQNLKKIAEVRDTLTKTNNDLSNLIKKKALQMQLLNMCGEDKTTLTETTKMLEDVSLNEIVAKLDKQ